ncbi:MAG: anhydro-N-acetylmuramic acid kinase [Nocardioidaceae bacterium]
MIVVGLIAGTSLDGIDACVAELEIDDVTIGLRLIGHRTFAYSEHTHQLLVQALPPASVDAHTVAEIDTSVGQEFAAAATAIVDSDAAGAADLVASHGQTFYHWVSGQSVLGTVQLGQPAWIAEATGLPVVADLRSRDIAAGGQGAPLAALLDVLLLRGSDRVGPLAALNIGGIANVTVVGEQAPPVAFDTGPGNALLDEAARRMGLPHGYDAGGGLAASGAVDEPLLAALLDDPYFGLSAPKSTGKEHFSPALLDHALEQAPVPRDADLLATLTELTAQTVAQALQGYGCQTVFASGGGAHNATLMRRLAQLVSPATLEPTAALGVPEDAKEAYLFALLGFLTWHGVPGTITSCTGAERTTVLGSLTPGAGPLQLPPAHGVEPTRLVVQPSR